MRLDVQPGVVQLELFKSALSLVLLLTTWLLGQRILLFWERRKKQNEIDLATLGELQKVYGEFRTVGRLWRTFALDRPTGEKVVCPDDGIHWQLHARAAAAEGSMEALVVKIATERRLDEEGIARMAILRESYQMLRRAIRDRDFFYWKNGSPQYATFNESVVGIVSLLATPSERPEAAEAVTNVRRIADAASTAAAKLQIDSRARP
ncbi:MAG: hypothetical protein ACXVEF_04125 [Polyangiales bacterium]